MKALATTLLGLSLLSASAWGQEVSLIGRYHLSGTEHGRPLTGMLDIDRSPGGKLSLKMDLAHISSQTAPGFGGALTQLKGHRAGFAVSWSIGRVTTQSTVHSRASYDAEPIAVASSGTKLRLGPQEGLFQVVTLKDGRVGFAEAAGLQPEKMNATLWLRAKKSGDLKGWLVSSGQVRGQLDLRRSKTFLDSDMLRMREFIEWSAVNTDLDCITTLNRAQRALFKDSKLRVGSRIDLTMKYMRRAKLAEAPYFIKFLDKDGRLTNGAREPEKAVESPWERVLKQSNGDRGWSVFSFSELDGVHAMMLVLDNRVPEFPRIAWVDQLKNGWRFYGKGKLEYEVDSDHHAWWDFEVKEKAIATLWRMTPRARGEVRLATVTTDGLNLRQEPKVSPGNEIRKATAGEEFVVGDRSGKWLMLLDAEGKQVWAHGDYVSLRRGVPSYAKIKVPSAAELRRGLSDSLR